MTKIREYNIIDQPRCLKIFESNCPEFFEKEELTGFKLWLNGLNNHVLVYRNSGSDHYFVLEENNNVIACGGYYVEKERPNIIMAWGMVDRAFHRKGYGKQLFQYRIDEIHNSFPEHSIILDTSQHTYKFFQKFGFTVNNIIANGYGTGLDRYDMKL